MIRVVLAGALGKVGRELVKALAKESDFRLVGAVGNSGVGSDVGELVGAGTLGVKLQPDLPAALAGQGADVLIDFSTAAASRELIPAAIASGIAPVVGTTGFAPGEFDAWAAKCRERSLGAAFCANFAIGAMLMMKFAAEARRFFPDVEIIELHHKTKLDAPSGTALRTVQRLAAAAGDLPGPEVPIHSVRLPGLIAHQEVLFGGPGQVLSIRHDAMSRESYVPGVLLACRWVLATKRVALDLEEMTR